MKHLLTPAIVAIMLACGSNRQSVESKPAPEPIAEEAPANAPQLGGPGKGDSLFLYLERTPCFGQCKAYRIDLYRSGYALYDGRGNMEKMGPHSSRAGVDSLFAIVNKAEELGFFAMDDKYDAEVTDIPSTYLRIIADGKDKRVLARVGVPPAFKKLVAEIESMLLPMPWIPVVAEP